MLRPLFNKALILLAMFSITYANNSFAEVKDASVLIKGQTILINSKIVIYGTGATKEMALKIQESILNYWGKDQKGQSWTYYDKVSKIKFKVKFNVSVVLYQNKTKARPDIILGKYDPTNRTNYIEISDEAGRSYVLGGDAGKWFTHRQAAHDSPGTYAHEFGHILGLDDRYTDVDEESVLHKGWEHNLMADSAHGDLEQRNINEVIKPIVGRFRPVKALRKSLSLPDNLPYYDEIDVIL